MSKRLFNDFIGGTGAVAMALAAMPPSARAQDVRPAGQTDLDTVIVTGTRDPNMKARDSASPIQVVSVEQLQATGANNVFDALQDVLPSLSGENFLEGRGELTRSARLRGLNPGEVLVLVNGKRRHNTANVDYSEDPNVGSNPVDLDMIPLSLIDHVEVLLDGASAQYGSDAVSGVINIILKHTTLGSEAYAGGGRTHFGDGAQAMAGLSHSMPLGSDGFLDLSLDYHWHDFENRNDINIFTIGQVDKNGVANGGVRNSIEGSPKSNLVTAGLNFEKPIGDATVYGFATAGHKGLGAYQNNRPDSKAPFVYPDGFVPEVSDDETDGAITGGIKGTQLLGWDWDVSGTYGRDHHSIGIFDTVNTGLLKAGLYSPTSASLGTEDNSQAVLNADFRRGLDIGVLAAPLNIAAGAEFRYETFALGAGDPPSYELGGTQASTGFTPTDVTKTSRNIEAVYADLSGKLLPNWLIDVAGRFEDYSQTGVGSTVNGKFTTRYDFSPQFAIRGTVSNGFHAPTLAQSHYAATGVSPTSLTLQAPPTSPGGQLLGALPLKPETSTDVDFGFVLEPLPNLHMTLDFYQIQLDKRIINSAYISGPLALQAAAANGNSIEPNSGEKAFIAFFNNGVDTRTRGIDLTADYNTDFGNYGRVKWTLAGNYNDTTITKIYAPPAQLQAALVAAGSPPSYVNQWVASDLTQSSPKSKVSLAAAWHIQKFDATVRETRYGQVVQNTGNTSAITNFANIDIKAAYITDLDAVYHLTDALSAEVGANNLFNKLPPVLPMALRQGRGSDLYPAFTPWGIAGGYYYGKITFKF